MKLHRSALHGILFTSMLAAAGCSALAAGADPSHSSRGAAWRIDAAAVPEIGIGRAPEADVPFIAPLERVDTTNLAPGALLDVWLNDRTKDLRTITSERSLGTAVVRGDFFRYDAVNADPDLRGFWGQPLLLKWSALLEIKERGAHVFVSELSRERSSRAISVRTLVRLNEETLFEKDVRVFGRNPISETGSRVLTLAPGFYRLEVWLSAQPMLTPATQLGTFIRVREPGVMTPELLPSSRIWHRVR